MCMRFLSLCVFTGGRCLWTVCQCGILDGVTSEAVLWASVVLTSLGTLLELRPFLYHTIGCGQLLFQTAYGTAPTDQFHRRMQSWSCLISQPSPLHAWNQLTFGWRRFVIFFLACWVVSPAFPKLPSGSPGLLAEDELAVELLLVFPAALP